MSAMLLGVAYAASIGGMSTIVGTAPNVVMVAFMLEEYGTEIDFASWMMVGLPLSMVMLPIAWVLLTRFVFKVNFKTSYEGRALLRKMKDDLGPITVPEKRVAIIVFTLALSWILRPLLTKLPGLEALDDSSNLKCFIIPVFGT